MVVMVALILAACGTTPTSSPTITIAVPHGWKTYSFEKAAISVPADWVVLHNNNCPDVGAPGTLLLGYPKVPFPCTYTPASTARVAVTSFPMGNEVLAGRSRVHVNGVPVEIGFGSPVALQWNAPTLGVGIIASGTLANRILHTLRPAT